MSAPPLIFDRRLRRLRLERALRGAPPDFLRMRVSEDLAERLSAVSRRFARALVIGPPWAAADLRAALAGTPAADRVGEIVALGLVAPASGPGLAIVADEEHLPFIEGGFDLVISSLALHAVNDVVGALIQIRRALKPDGLFLGALLGGGSLTELRQSLMRGELAARGGSGPRVAPFIDAHDAAGLLQRAGFALPVADTDLLTVRYRQALTLMADLRALGETNILHERPPVPLTRTALAETWRAYGNEHADVEGRLLASFEIITLTGWAPHPDQPRPARRGSGKVSLTEALRPQSEGEDRP
ncbi:MAG: methyltransferase domain-containing protein [Alphaproteobacteria bacterium]|nr:methyltransferase domain-containing protein [Alphaproteobacteria bacterium]